MSKVRREVTEETPVSSHDLIHISLVTGRPLLFAIDDIKRARALGIVGTLTGTLPAAPQQNLFQGVPLQLMTEECLWLVRHGHAFVVPDKQFIKDLYAHLTPEDLDELERIRCEDLEQQKSNKRDEYEKKMQKLGVKKYKQDETLTDQGLAITIPNTPQGLPNYLLFSQIYAKSTHVQERIISNLSTDHLSYDVYTALRQRGYYLAPGLRFGSRFIGYPGDPLRFHAHLVVNPVGYDEDIGLMNIVGGGRLATGVKKLWTVGSKDYRQEDREDADDEVKFFTIEWAGFG